MANQFEAEPHDKEIEQIKLFLNSAKSKVGAVFARLGFHFLALVTAGLLMGTVTAMTFPHKLENIKDGFALLVYLSIIVIFPRRKQPINSAIALLTSLIWCFFGPWQLALAWGAAQRILLDIIETKTLFYWRKIGTIFLCLMIFKAFFELNPMPYVSGFFLFFFGFFTVLGSVVKLLYVRFQESKASKLAGKIADKPVAEIESKAFILKSYEKLVDQLSIQCTQLPPNLVAPVADICHQTQSILHSMATDPRDFEPGDKFLKRYLVAVQKIMGQSQKLLNSEVKSVEVERALKESELLLIRLSDAFTEQQTRLLENDMQDLTIELNVLDKLLKMEGYK